MRNQRPAHYDEMELPGWFSLATILLAALGLVLSALTIWTHLKATTLGIDYSSFCNINATFNCDAVSRSSWSTLFGIPLGSYAVIFYLITIFFGIVNFNLKRSAAADIQLVISTIVLLFSLALLIVSISSIGSLCLVCLGMDLVNLLLFFIALICRTSDLNIAQRFTNGIKKIFEFPKALLGLADYKGSSESMIMLAGFLFAIVVNFLTLYGTYLVKDHLKEMSLSQYGVEQYEREVKRIVDEWRSAPEQNIPLSFEKGEGADYFIGAKDAAIRLVEFSDIQCPFCRKIFPLIVEAVKGYEDQVVFISKSFPLDPACNPTIQGTGHPFSCIAAHYTVCAGQQDKFWELTKIFYNLAELELDSSNGDPQLAMYTAVKKLGMDMDAFDICISQDKSLAKVRTDIKVAEQIGLTGTPSFWINGKRLKSAEPKILHMVFEEILSKQKTPLEKK